MLGETRERQWKQINFRTVKTVLGMEFLHELYNRYHPEINCLRFKNTVIATEGKQVTSYAPKDEWEFMGKWFGKRFLKKDQAVIDNLQSYLDRPKERFHRFLEEMETADITELDNEELAMALIDIQFVPLTELYTVNHVQIEHALNGAIDTLLEREFDDEEEFNKAKSTLIYADKLTVGVEEKQAFYELVKDGLELGIDTIEQGDGNAVTAVRDHFEEYRYIHSAYGAEPYEFEYYVERYNDLADKGIAHIETTLQQIEAADKRAAHRREEYLSKIDHNEQLKELVELMASVGTLRDRNKALLGQSTKYREQLLNEISERSGVPREELNWYFLTELCKLLDNGSRIDDETIASRKVGMVFTRNELVDTNASFAIEDDATGVLAGECASVGTYEGVVRVVRDSSDNDRMNLGDVMVAPGTDFDLINAMQRAGAIVTEEGGILSHAAVISRELDIPCLIGVEKATELLEGGKRVRVDADGGEITVLGDQI
ncbi:PEP-utilizing enzyme [Halocatena salina]|uniref:PEP-utilizing enzyme n=1 Tax=Halocatena salina TaxID=2934340 RepID=A0A8U0A285_9EURY|nr:PEP-utilizing enzyme [Halocatena salina]UPM43174.1 PEP-utilizing enzyme [Halocatena salina]